MDMSKPYEERRTKIMEKKDIDWANLGFGYMVADYRYVANYKDGKWDEGQLITDPDIVLNDNF